MRKKPLFLTAGGREDPPGPAREERPQASGNQGAPRCRQEPRGLLRQGPHKARHTALLDCAQTQGLPVRTCFRGLPEILFLSEVHWGKDSVSDLKSSFSPQSAYLSHLHFCRMKMYLKTIFDVILPQPFLENKESEHFLKKKITA